MLIYPHRLSKPAHINKYIERTQVLRPSKAKTTYHFRKVIDRHIHTIDGNIEVVLTIKNKRLKGITVSRASKLNFLEIIKANNNQIELFEKGYERISSGFEITEIKDNDQILVRYGLGPSYLIMIFEDDELIHLSRVNKNVLIESYSIDGDRVIINLPITENTGFNTKLIGYVGLTFAFPVGMFLYFESILITIGVMTFSACSLWINDFVNPRRHPIINIIQAIIYAVVFALLR